MGIAVLLKMITEPRDFPGVMFRYLAISLTNSFSFWKSSGVTCDEESSIKITSATKSFGPSAADRKVRPQKKIVQKDNKK